MLPDSPESRTARRAALWQALIASDVGHAWHDAAKGCLGVLVSAGPSLARNGALLAEGSLAQRRLVVATMDAMGPLERLGVRPDVVVACESPRSVDAEAAIASGAPVVAWGEAANDPMLAPSVLAVACDAQDSDATLAVHLLLRHLGCDPVALVGVDLAFVDGVAHAPGHALDRAWALETNAFRSWDWLHAQRIALRSGGLVREADRGGRTVLMDAMLRRERAALEAAFDEDRRAGARVIDATEGGCTKRHSDQMTLREALERFAIRRVPSLPRVPVSRRAASATAAVQVTRESHRAIAVVPIDPVRGGTGVERSLEAELGDRSVLHHTLKRLLHSKELHRVVMVAPKGWDARPALDGLEVRDRLELLSWDGDVVEGDARGRFASRAWADACWRGGIGGRSVFDEVLAPKAMRAAMELHQASEVFLCGPDWPLVAVREPWGVDAMVQRLSMLPARPWMQFALGPAGSSGCLLSSVAVKALEQGTVRSIGAWLDTRMDWSGHAERLRAPMSIAGFRERLIMDTPRAARRMRLALEPLMHGDAVLSMETMLAAVARQSDAAPNLVPQHLVIELCTGRRGCGLTSPHRFGSLQRPPMTAKRLERLLSRVAEARDVAVTLAGAGDPMIHPDVHAFVDRIRAAGALAIEVRTELRSPAAVEDLQRLDVDVITADLHAVDAPGYRTMMGPADFDGAVQALHALAMGRGHAGGALAHPWLLPRVERLRESVPWVTMFLQTWSRDADGAVVDPPPQRDPWGNPIPEAPMPACGEEIWAHLDMLRRVTVLSDGRVPAVDGDLLGNASVGSVDQDDLVTLYRLAYARRRSVRTGVGLSQAVLT